MQATLQLAAATHLPDEVDAKRSEYRIRRRFTGERSLRDVLINMIKAHS